MSALTPDDRKAFVKRWAEEVWNQGKLEKLSEFFTDDHIFHDPQFPDGRGLEAIRELVGSFRAAFPDVRVEIEEAICEGDFVAERFSMRGTHLGEIMGVAPTGEPMEATGMVFYRFSGGKIAEQWANWDALGLLQQIGAVAMPE
jgi:steroid delta-isomerase-like uncharacterized protein